MTLIRRINAFSECVSKAISSCTNDFEWFTLGISMLSGKATDFRADELAAVVASLARPVRHSRGRCMGGGNGASKSAMESLQDRFP